MDNERDLIGDADRLMRRHRVFVAGAANPAAPSDADDLPVLTDQVDINAVEPVKEPEPVISPEEQAEVLAHELLLQRLSAQRQAIEKEVIVWLDKELPQIVGYVIDGITDQLVAQVTAAMRLELLPKLQLAVEAEEESQPSRHDPSD